MRRLRPPAVVCRAAAVLALIMTAGCGTPMVTTPLPDPTAKGPATLTPEQKQAAIADMNKRREAHRGDAEAAISKSRTP